jgi:hypothetical protein
MIYFHAYSTGADGRQSVAIAVVEDAGHAARFEAQGYTRCTQAAFRAAWQLRDACALAQLRTAASAAPRRLSSELAAHQVGINRALY